MVDDLCTTIQRAVLEAWGPEIDPAAKLRELRPALKQLRKDYDAPRAPDFSNPRNRAAYAFAYFPHHAVLAAKAYLAAGPLLLGLDRPLLQVAVLGAGPGPEVVGLVQVIEKLGIAPGRIEFDLIDREQGWSTTRRTTIDRVLPQISDIRVEVREHFADLASPRGIESITPLLKNADLVVAETLLTELPDAAGERQLLEHLFGNLGAESRLLIVDLHKMRAFGPVVESIGTGPLVTVMRADAQESAGRPIEPIASSLFAKEDRLWPRAKLNVQARLLSRPGVISRATQRRHPGLLDQWTPDQQAALATLDRFLDGPDRVAVLRGTAGTGKTTLFAPIIESAARRDLPVRLLAPTGQAASRLGERSGVAGSTIHSAVYRFDKTELAEEHGDRTDSGPEGRDEPMPVTVFERSAPPPEDCVYLVDEASLVGDRCYQPSEIAGSEVRFGNGRLLSDLLAWALAAPGSKVVLAGDPAQLPPVGEQSPPAFDSATLTELTGQEPVVAQLTEVVRQGDGSTLVEFALQAGQASYRHGLPTIPEDPSRSVSKLKPGELEPWLHAEILDGRATVVAWRHVDVAAWNHRVRTQASRPDDRPTSGDRLMVLSTNARRGLLNGDGLVVVEADDHVEVVRLRDKEVSLRRAIVSKPAPGLGKITIETLLVDDLLHRASAADHQRVSQILYVDFLIRSGLKPGDPEFEAARRNDDRVSALRVAYAYARTCHRAQGGEWDNVVVDFAGTQTLGPLFGRWAYTALTRARRAAWIRNAPHGRHAIQESDLVEAAEGALVAEGFDVELVGRLQHGGVKLEVAEGPSRVIIDLHQTKGLPSNPVRRGQPADIEARVLQVLRAWIDNEERAGEPELPDRLLERCARISDQLSEQGLDLDIRSPAAYQVSLSVSDGRNSALVRFSHTGAGALTTEVPVGSGKNGNLTLLEQLRTAIHETSDG